MVLKDEVINAFATLGLEPDVELSVASTAYKKAALKHHPDRNHGDTSAKERFQEIGHAWSICQRHYENPRSSEKRAFDGFGCGRRPHPYDDDDDDDDDDYMDDDVREDFFAWLFAEMMFNRYSHSSGRRYRREHAAHGRDRPSVFTFSRGFPSSEPSYTTFSNEPRYLYQSRPYDPASQKKQDAEFEKRVREFEREQAEEEAQIKNAEREAHSSQMRLASHQDRAFNLGKEGKGSEMRAIIEQHDLDVTKPRNLKPSKKQTKQTDQSGYVETMLHVAAASCDASLVDWLIQRGADTAALDPSRHTPFHISILKGNISVVERFLSLYRNIKSTDPQYPSVREGCHPSKASKDAQSNTPLQMAIKCGKLELVELLSKEATVHDVEKCWTQLQLNASGREIRELLLTKNGFFPPEDLPKQGLSKKAALKLQKQEEEKRIAEEKARRLAEEGVNRLAKQARREKAQKEEAERKTKREAEEAKIRAEEEAEKLRIVAEQAKLRAAEQAERKRVEAEQARIRVAEEAERRRVEAEQKRVRAAEEAERKRVEAEQARIRAVEEAERKRVEAEDAARKRAAEEENRRQVEVDKQRKAEEEKQRRKKEEERILRELEARRKANEEQRKAEKAQRVATRQREREKASRRAAEARTTQAIADEARVTQKVQQAEEESKRDPQQRDAQLETTMRLRADQSIRDKARIREKRARAKDTPLLNAAHCTQLQTSVEPAIAPVPTPTPMVVKRKHEVRPLPRLQSNVATVAAPVEVTLKSSFVPLSPPMTPEDLQTIVIPDDLFHYEPSQPSSQDAMVVRATPLSLERSAAMQSRRTTRAVPQPPATPSPSIPSDELSHHGNGVPCRYFGLGKKGCKQGNQCMFSHMLVPSRPGHSGAIRK